LSQLRIRIEQTFGLRTGKWRILHQTLQAHLKKVEKIFMCITRLHNFCINKVTEGYVFSTNFEDKQGGDDEAMILPVNESGVPESSVLRDIIVNDLVQRGLERPNLVKLQIILI